MDVFAGATAFTKLILSIALATATQAPQQEVNQATGIIRGRVTIGKKAAAGVSVVLTSIGANPQREHDAIAVTDLEGRYQLEGVAAGQYSIAPFAPAFVPSEAGTAGRAGKTIKVSDAEVLENIDFTLTLGGVITGRVIDFNNRPIIDQRIALNRIDDREQKLPVYLLNRFLFKTDDLGVYRIYGLPSGRYIVSVGDEAVRASGIVLGSLGERTFHPGVTDETNATVVEVTAGLETKDIDIKLGQPTKTYFATGRIMDAETGTPVPMTTYICEALDGQGKAAELNMRHGRSDPRGEIRIEGLLPGRYSVRAIPESKSNSYSEPVSFEIADRNLSGLEIKLVRGSQISGAVVVENANEANLSDKFAQASILAQLISPESGIPQRYSARINSDGSFHMGGLRPGRLELSMAHRSPSGKWFSLVRVERDGIEQPGGIEIAAGEHVENVSVVLDYGAAAIYGEIKLKGGNLPRGSRLFVYARPVEDSGAQKNINGQIEARGRFAIAGLTAGEYEVTAEAVLPAIPGSPQPSRSRAATKTVKVTTGEGVEITLVIDLSDSGQETKR